LNSDALATMTEQKKYILLKNESIVVNAVILYRIEAITSFRTRFGKVHVGDKGGYVESEYNLSHTGCCWIWDDAKVCGGAKVQNNAQVGGKARVFDSATVRNDAIVYGYAVVHGESSVYNAAEVYEDADIWSSNISDRSVVRGTSLVQNSEVYGSSEILGDSVIKNCTIYWSTLNRVNLNNCIGMRHSYITETYINNVTVELNHAVIQCTNDLMSVGPIGSRSAYTTFFIGRKHPGANLQIMVRCGCFLGTMAEFETAVKTKYTEDNMHYIEYMDAIEMATHKLGTMLAMHKANEQAPLSEDLDGDHKVLIS